ncbi:MAG TPA: 4Fe-4S binding protein [Methanoregula sp.]|nr:4Fe-4S binding protein [Methanoregula sp.]
MQVMKSIRRTLASLLLTAGLVYPACAAVCPKGIGGCPTPGRCFLFTDADGNALCDYTSRAVSLPARTPSAVPAQPTAPVTATPTPSPSAAQVTTTSAPAAPVSTTSPDFAASVPENPPPGGFLDTILQSALVTEILLFLLVAGVLFALVRSGKAGVRIQGTLPALALSSFFGLGLSLITTSLLTGDTGAGTVYALTYMGIGTVLAAYLWHTGVMTRKVVLLAATLGTIAGFVFLAPIMPLELGGIINVLSGASALTYGVVIICSVIVLALVTGRTFCGTICPVGLLQELLSAVPVKKIVVQDTRVLESIRLAVFAVTSVAAFYLIDLMSFTGLYDLFSLTISAGLAAAAGILVVSVFLYRPVCRIICPFGVLFSLFAEFSWFRLRRSDTCISCRKCEKTCPTRTAGPNDSKRECYLCGRCTGVCPVGTALAYRR